MLICWNIIIGILDYLITMFAEVIKLVMNKALAITNRTILVSFPVADGSLAFQRKLRYEHRCFLRLYSYEDITRLLVGLNISSFAIEKIQIDFFVTINLN